MYIYILILLLYLFSFISLLINCHVLLLVFESTYFCFPISYSILHIPTYIFVNFAGPRAYRAVSLNINFSYLYINLNYYFGYLGIFGPRHADVPSMTLGAVCPSRLLLLLLLSWAFGLWRYRCRSSHRFLPGFM